MTNMLKSKQFVLVIIAVILFISCNEAGKTDTVALKEKAKTEIANAEKDFEKMAAEKGIAEAFLVLCRFHFRHQKTTRCAYSRKR